MAKKIECTISRSCCIVHPLPLPHKICLNESQFDLLETQPPFFTNATPLKKRNTIHLSYASCVTKLFSSMMENNTVDLVQFIKRMKEGKKKINWTPVFTLFNHNLCVFLINVLFYQFYKFAFVVNWTQKKRHYCAQNCKKKSILMFKESNVPTCCVLFSLFRLRFFFKNKTFDRLTF
jgi:hypothetical protein